MKGKFALYGLIIFFLMPTFLFVISCYIYPIFRNILLSFFNIDIMNIKTQAFIGLKNYYDVLSDSRFLNALKNTVFFVIVSVFFEFIIGFGLALLTNESFHGRSFVRALVILPWALPTAIMAAGWKYIYDPLYGPIVDILLKLGIINEPIALLANPTIAMWCCILSDVWKTAPMIAIILLAGLQSIPKDLYDAANIDGADTFYRFRFITLPLLIPAILLALVFRVAQAFGVFDLIYVLTFGGPGQATEPLAMYIHHSIFFYYKLSYGATLAIFSFLINFVVGLIYIKIMGKRI
jgi:multiple sugar transport system permease protein